MKTLKVCSTTTTTNTDIALALSSRAREVASTIRWPIWMVKARERQPGWDEKGCRVLHWLGCHIRTAGRAKFNNLEQLSDFSHSTLGAMLEVSYNHWQNCWNDGSFRGAPLPHFNVVRRKGKTWPTFEQTFAAAILNVKSTLNGGKGGCWIFFLNLNVKQGVVRCAFQLLLPLIVGQLDLAVEALLSSSSDWFLTLRHLYLVKESEKFYENVQLKLILLFLRKPFFRQAPLKDPIAFLTVCDIIHIIYRAADIIFIYFRFSNENDIFCKLTTHFSQDEFFQQYCSNWPKKKEHLGRNAEKNVHRYNEYLFECILSNSEGNDIVWNAMYIKFTTKWEITFSQEKRS